MTLPEVFGPNSAFHRPFGLTADFYIAALPRSGSTVISNMLSDPQTMSICLIEPHFNSGAKGVLVSKQLAPYIDVSFEALEQMRSRMDREQWYEKVLKPTLSTLNCWGVKEVRPELHCATISYLKPKVIILSLRDLQSAFASLLDKCHFDMGKTDLNYAIEFTEKFLTDSCKELLKIDSEHQCIGIPYVSEISSDKVRRKLEAQTNLKLSGEPNQHFDFIGRQREVEKQKADFVSEPTIPSDVMKQLFNRYKNKNSVLVEAYGKLVERTKSSIQLE